MRRAIWPGVYVDRIQPCGALMLRTYAGGRQVLYRWHETAPDTGSGVWLIVHRGDES